MVSSETRRKYIGEYVDNLQVSGRLSLLVTGVVCLSLQSNHRINELYKLLILIFFSNFVS